MPKQISNPDRTARTVRSNPKLVERIDEVAFRKRAAFNEVANEFFEDGVRLSALDDDLREILVEVGQITARVLKAREEQPLTGNARLVNAERVMRLAVTEALERRLVATTPVFATELWAGAIEIVEELGLTGEPWNVIASIRSTSPPLSDADMRRIEEGINRRVESATDHEKKRLEAMAAYVAHAQHQHLEDWEDVKKEARADLEVALGVVRKGSSSND